MCGAATAIGMVMLRTTQAVAPYRTTRCVALTGQAR